MLKLETQANLARAQELYYDKKFVEAQVELYESSCAEPYRQSYLAFAAASGTMSERRGSGNSFQLASSSKHSLVTKRPLKKELGAR